MVSPRPPSKKAIRGILPLKLFLDPMLNERDSGEKERPCRKYMEI